jgi:hypothetical protein
MRFTAMSDLLVVAPDTNRILVIFWTARKTKGGDSAAKLLSKDEARRPGGVTEMREATALTTAKSVELLDL